MLIALLFCMFLLVLSQCDGLFLLHPPATPTPPIPGYSVRGKRWCKYIHAIALSSFIFNCAMSSSPVLALDAASSATTSSKAPIIYKSGKSPEGLPSSKADSKKDISFLRCISQCKSDCQKPGEGLARRDCVQDCQDQCCESYEQCSFKIKTSVMGNGV